ncbi:dioxygenase [Nocardia sp. NPDC002869]|uniref:dioxygenase n=1 Tax=Nocardia sp. NPDC002869 TaxID=3161032 RepID=UPI00398D4FF6
MSVMLSRRRALWIMGAVGTASVAAACSSGTGTTTTGSASSTAAASGTAVAAAPQETAGPYHGDGSNGPDVLVESGVVRSDITGGFGSYTGTVEGVPVTIRLTLQDLARDGAAGKGMALYLWHCDRDGEDSLYGRDITEQNYLRGVQVADEAGQVSFTSIFPACCSGRRPHIHFEVYDSLATAVAGENARLTSQIALPQEACEQVFGADSGYARSVPNLGEVTLAGDPKNGMEISLTVGVAEKSANRAEGGPGQGGTPPEPPAGGSGPGGAPPAGPPPGGAPRNGTPAG